MHPTIWPIGVAVHVHSSRQDALCKSLAIISYFNVTVYNHNFWNADEVNECTAYGPNGGEDVYEMPSTMTGGKEFTMRKCAAYERSTVGEGDYEVVM